MRLVIGARLQGFSAPGSMGVVRDMTFINCYWPKLDQPTRIFADGSSGIKVMGATPRNVWFPDDIEFLPWYPDALYPAEQAVFKAFPFRRSLVNLSTSEAQVWMDAYNAAVKSFPATHTVLETPRHVNFLRRREESSRRTITLTEESVQRAGDVETRLPAGTQITKIAYEEFVAELTPQECLELVDGRTARESLEPGKVFVHVSEVNRDPQTGEKTPVTLDQWKLSRESADGAPAEEAAAIP